MAADALQAPLAGEFLFYLRRRGMAMDRIVAAWRAMLDGPVAG